MMCLFRRSWPALETLRGSARSDRSYLGEPPDCILIVPAHGGFPCGRRLRSDVVRVVVETGGVVRKRQVEVGDVDVRLVPIDQRDPIRGDADVARVGGIAVDDARLTSSESLPRCSASSRGRSSSRSRRAGGRSTIASPGAVATPASTDAAGGFITAIG